MERPAQYKRLRDARVHYRRGEFAAAMALLREALQTVELDAHGLEVAKAMADKAGDPALVSECLARLCQVDPTNLEWPFELCVAALKERDAYRANQWLARAKEIDPNHPEVHRLRVRVLKARGTLDRPLLDLGRMQDALADPAVPEKIALQAVRMLVFNGLTDPARAGLERLNARPNIRLKWATEIETQMKVIETIEACRAAGGDFSPLNTPDAATFHRRDPSESAAIVFSGIDGQFANVPLNLIQAILEPLGVHAIYLKDVKRLMHMVGNPDLGRDYAETVQALRNLLDAWGVRRLVTIGASGGGPAALRYGIDLGARRVLAFGAPTTMQADLLWEEGRGLTILKRLEELAPDKLGPLHPVVAAGPAKPLIDLYFGSEMALDRGHAEALADLENVRLKPIVGLDKHGVPGELLLRGELAGMIADALRDEHG